MTKAVRHAQGRSGTTVLILQFQYFLHADKESKTYVMLKDNNVSTIALFAAAGALAVSWFTREDIGPTPATERTANPQTERTLLDVDTRIATLETKSSQALASLELRLNQQSQKLAELPSTQQIITAMEQLLTRTHASLEQRLTAQAQSIDVLKAAVATTDSLLNRALEFTKETLSERPGA